MISIILASEERFTLVELHDSILFYVVLILFGLGWIMFSIVFNYSSLKSELSLKYLNLDILELIWTITPAVILILIAFPSFKLLYLMDEVSDPAMSVLAEDHSWYWSSQYSDFLNADGEFIEFDSYLSDFSPMNISDLLNPAGSESAPSGSGSSYSQSWSPGPDMSTIRHKILYQMSDRCHNLRADHIYNSNSFGENAINSSEHSLIKEKLLLHGFVEREGKMFSSPTIQYPPRASENLLKMLRD